MERIYWCPTCRTFSREQHCASCSWLPQVVCYPHDLLSALREEATWENVKEAFCEEEGRDWPDRICFPDERLALKVSWYDDMFPLSFLLVWEAEGETVVLAAANIDKSDVAQELIMQGTEVAEKLEGFL